MSRRARLEGRIVLVVGRDGSSALLEHVGDGAWAGSRGLVLDPWRDVWSGSAAVEDLTGFEVHVDGAWQPDPDPWG